MPRFPLLSPGHYQCTTFDYLDATSGLCVEDWIRVFRSTLPTFKAHAARDMSLTEEKRQAGCKQFEADFNYILDVLSRDPKASIMAHEAQPLNCLSLCRIRDKCLHDAGFHDIFRAVKEKENQLALELLPGVLREIDGLPDAVSRWGLCLRGVFAGNIFDLGAASSAERYEKDVASFSDAREGLLSRPWAIDDFSEMVQRLSSKAYEKVLMFVDNAGSDMVLGMLPVAREFLKYGSVVVMASNRGPTINDMTAAELTGILDTAANIDLLLGEALGKNQLRVVCSGSDDPVIDLGDISEALAEECSDVDFVILEGMGRSIETNLYAKFQCDSFKLGMIKHQEVAHCLNGRLYDVVCKFDRAHSHINL